MRRFATLAVLTGIAFTACSGSDSDTDSTTARTPDPGTANASTTSVPAPDPTPEATVADDDPTTTVVESTTTTVVEPTEEPTSDPTQPDPVSQADLENFLASVEAAIEGSRHEGVVFDAPEIYIALAQAACARFSEGHSLDEIANDMLGEIDGADSTDDERLVGALLGAATRTICPEHADKI